MEGTVIVERPDAILQAMQASVEDGTETFLAVVSRAEIGAVLSYIAALEAEREKDKQVIREMMEIVRALGGIE